MAEEEIPASTCPKCDGSLVVVGIDERFLECSCGYKFDTFTSKEVRQEESEESILEVMSEKEAADEVMAEYQFATIADGTSETTMRYVKGVYRDDADAIIKGWIEAHILMQPSKMMAPKAPSSHFVNEVIGHVRRCTFVAREDFDSDPRILNLRNGLFDTVTGTLSRHRPDFLSVTQLPEEYNPDSKCPLILKFLSEVCYPEDIPVLQEFIGYALYKGYPANKALLLIGEGENGKSVFLGILKRFLGSDNISSRSLQELETHYFAKADLFGKMANIYPDLPDTALRATGIFKILTGNDPITGEHKYLSGFTFVNYAKLIFSANKVPEVYEDTRAFFRRWILVTFPNTFGPEKADRNLLDKLTTQEELNGLLVWAMEGLARLRANGWNFSNSKSVEAVREEYIRKSSPLQAFFMDCVEPMQEGFVTKQNLYRAFADYCREKRMPILGQETFFKKMQAFPEYRYPVERRGNSRERGFVGLKLKTAHQDQDVHDFPIPSPPPSTTIDSYADKQSMSDDGHAGHAGQAEIKLEVKA